jgi:dTDP-4-dehydrorhamnose 3,5-epimerase
MGITFEETKLKGAFLLSPERFDDVRGFLSRSFSAREFEERGLNPRLAECNISFSKKKYTVRGMHFQHGQHAQAKLVRCTRGGVFDVIIDLRPDSDTYTQWIGLELTDENYHMLYVPEGFAHGFQTLVDNTEIFYQISNYYTPGSEGGVRWDDPLFGINWPEREFVTINERDRTYADFRR